MREILNRNSYPQALVDAVTADPYHKGDCDFSCTELLKPPRQRALQKKHESEITVDVEERIWSLLGQAVHTILERANSRDLAEKRFFTEVAGFKISAQIDTLELVNFQLSDWKCTTSYKFIKGEPIPWEYEAQLNIQKFILEMNGLVVKSLRIIGILRDHSKARAKRDKNYPQVNVAIMDIPVWPRSKTIAFIEERIALMISADKVLPDCSVDERWAEQPQFAVRKKKNKKALKLYSSQVLAENHAEKDPDLIVDFRPGSPGIRCEDYCEVAQFCTQYKQLKGEKLSAI